MKDFIVENDFNYKGFRCVTIFTDMGVRNGYVGMPYGSSCYGCDYSIFDIECHGGLTYGGGGLDSKYPVGSDLWWLGFDCGHCWDGQDLKLALERFPQNKHVLEVMIQFPDDLPVRTAEYVSEECKKIVDQLLAKY